jgi:hypothetical protein
MTFEEIKSKIDFASINELRLKNKKIIDSRSSKFLGINFIIFVALVIFIWPHVNFLESIFIPFIVVILIYTVLYRLFIRKYEVQFKKGFRESVLDRLLKDIGYDLKLNIEKPLTQSEFSKGKLHTSFNDFESEELFEGNIEDTPVKFSEVHLKSKSRYSTRTIFRGFYANFNYNFNEDLVIDVIQDESGDKEFLQKMNFSRDKLVKVDDQSFEKKYVVYSNQPELASELVSQKFINELATLSDAVNSTVYFSIRKGSIHLSYKDGVNHFVMDHNKPVEELTENFFKDITKMYAIMSQLKTFIDLNILPVLVHK